MSEQTDAPADEASGAEHEATAQPVTLDWAGETFDLPASTDEWDIAVIRAVEAGNNMRAIEIAFGPEFARLEKAHRAANDGRFTVSAMEDLVTAWFGAYGIDPGNF